MIGCIVTAQAAGLAVEGRELAASCGHALGEQSGMHAADVGGDVAVIG
jgi:hypothetical protein